MVPQDEIFCCPKCGGALFSVGGALKCFAGHSYDRAKQGYVNLRLSQQSSKKRHGDDRLMVLARERFLNAGYYAPLRQKIYETVAACRPETLADAGCGEGYYTAYLEARLPKTKIAGMDISKDALKAFGRRNTAVKLALASVFDMPLRSASCDMILCVFAPDSAEEFQRVLKPQGKLLRVLPGEDHLFELKSAIYERPYKNPAPSKLLKLRLLKEETLRFQFTLKNTKEIADLFCMTPYFYKTGKADQEKTNKLSTLTVTADFCLQLYEKEEAPTL